MTSSALRLIADAALPDIQRPDVVVVPGGPGQNAHMADEALLEWLRAADEHSAWTTSVCSGSLLLASAGLLTGRRATTHWLAMDKLAGLGAVPAAERVVTDGKYVTAAGVSAGLDMALTLAGKLAGQDTCSPDRPHSQGDVAPVTVLAVPQVRVSARWISCLGPASIDRQVTGMAGTAGHRRHPDERTR
jgi:hypothetical protein